MKRILSVIMLVCLLMSLGTVSAFAGNVIESQSDFEAAMNGAASGATLMLGAGPFKMVAPSCAVTLQGNGSTVITFPDGEQYPDMIKYVGINGGAAPIDTGDGDGNGSGGGQSDSTGTTVNNLDELKTALAAGGVINLGANISYGDVGGSGIGLVITKSVTINGGGNYTLTYTGSGRAINVNTTGTVTLNDLTITSSGERGVNIIKQAPTVILNNVSISAKNYAVHVANTISDEVTLTISGGDYSGKNVLNINAKTTASVSGATLTTNDDAPEGYGTITLSATAQGSKVTLSNTTLNYVGTGGSNFNNLTGEALSNVMIDKGGNSFACEPAGKNLEAQIDYNNGYSYGFSSLSDAIAKAQNGETIILLRDVDLGGQVIAVPDGVTVEQNDHNITNGGLKTGNTIAMEESTTVSEPINITGTGEVEMTLTQSVSALSKASGVDSIFKLAPGASVHITNVTGSDEELEAMRKLVSSDYCVSKGSILIKDAHDLTNGTVCGTCGVDTAKAASPKTGSVPATGDMSNMPLWSVLFLGFAVIAVLTRKREA